MRKAHRRIAARSASALAMVSAACGPGERATPATDSVATSPPAAPAASAAITLPPGFTASIFADTIGSARHAAAAPNGDLYVNTWRSPYDTTRRAPAGGFIVALRDSNRDGRADLIRRFGTTAKAGSRGGTGIALRDGALYVEADSAIVRYALGGNSLVPAGAPDTIVLGLTMEGGHPMHPIAVDGRGNLFVNMGSATNACQKKDRTPGSPGARPCPELRTRAGIWRFSASRTGQRFTPAARYATGIRNAVGLAVHPGDGSLYATQHGRDQLAENWPQLFTFTESAELPAEELLRIVEGGDYGWPHCYYDPTQQRLVLAPEYGGDGKTVGMCKDKLGPVAVFPAHWAPNGLGFYSDSAFPSRYRGGAFIAFHGSWNRAPEPQQGYNVVFQPLDDGKVSGEFQVFADGFAGARKEPGLAEHRPSGVAVGPGGALFITDDQRGRVWRVTHAGSR
ncbi:MAG: PQQ-dependent sugar dehydrogenase [Gemmatimonadales bacterium]